MSARPLSFRTAAAIVSASRRALPRSPHRDPARSDRPVPGLCRRFAAAVLSLGTRTDHAAKRDSNLIPFDERRIGLDHLAFACRSRGDLEAWEIRLDEVGVANGGIVDADYGSGLSCRDPDNIALEFLAPAF